MAIKSIHDVSNLMGVRVLLRLDLNVPIQHGKIVDDFRIRKAFPILDYLKEKGAKTIIISHIEGKDEKTLKPITEYLEKKYKIEFVSNFKNAFKQSQGLEDGSFLLLENIRTNEGEKTNSDAFAKELATLGDIYVNEAFSVSHREHASVVAITKYIPSYAGIVFMDEITHLSKAFKPDRPFIFILGGVKFDTKLPLIQKFMEVADHVFIAGALANNFFKEMGKEIGVSIASDQNFNLKQYFDNTKLLLPVDVIVQEKVIKKLDEVTPTDKILDVGPESIKMLKERISSARFVLWNGPLGNYEGGFKEPTLELARIIAESGVESAVGGGDTLAAISELNLWDKYTFVSTGGGAMLDYLANGTLPGISALEQSGE